MKLANIFLILIYVYNIVSVLILIFVKRSDTRVIFAWLIVFLFLPYIGFIFYFLIGSKYKMRVMSKKYGMSEIEEKHNKALDKQIYDISADKIKFKEIETEKFRDLIILNSKNAMSYFTQNNNVELLISAQENFSHIFEDIKNATKSVEVLYYIFRAKDNVGKEFISLLIDKANQGVKVTLIYDGIGSLHTHMRDFKGLKKAGGHVYRFLPSIVRSVLLVNYRLHRKLVIVDGKIAYTGGINVGDEYFGLKKINKPWRDTTIRLTGDSVLSLQTRFWTDLVFLQNQNFRKKKKAKFMVDEKVLNSFYSPIEEGNLGVQILSSGPSSRNDTIKDAYVKMITSAKKYLYIQTPYFVPDKTILESLRLAAACGVDVRIMLPGIPDKKPIYAITLLNVAKLLNDGVKVYLHSGFLHAKTIVIDDQVSTVGTANIDIRSFSLNYETNAFIYNNEFAIKCRDIFLDDIKDCTIFNAEIYSKRGLWKKVYESIWRFIAPIA
ncbi:cardiolipin synthase [Clostridium psychrophilum]|uniref:cardiolipin synthase n=1 Tax=Clostridium psychrophilum TaxID=132926 RepID=UPI001C0DFF89|nr:cardiolipin synthase [Clostridium psychrophilum]MBU3181669.1 cardiolipin synthase [Clostridium psychrophilum]